MTGSVAPVADVGESFGAWTAGDDSALLPLLTDADVACGYHAGDPRTMDRTVARCLHLGVSIGAHPGFPDLADRGCRPDGTPVPRAQEGAVLRDAGEIADRAVRAVVDGRVRAVDGADVPVRADLVLLHGHEPAAVIAAHAVRDALVAEAVTLEDIGRVLDHRP